MSRLFDYKYLSIEHLKGFSNYKYSSIDNSPLAVYVSHPFWNQVVKLYPMWLAPNVLTFGGMLLVMAAFGLVSCYDYDLTASNGPADVLSTHPVPNWVWLFCSLAMFLAHTMDGTDGKQARRTGASGPTGELFDHGIDSWMTIPFTVTLFSIFGRTDSSVDAFRQMLILMSVQLVFVITHWEKYNTGILFLSWCYDASQYALVIMYFVTWVAGGYLFWKFYLIPGFLTPANVMEYLFYFSCFGMSIPMSLYNIQKARKAGTCKQPNFYEAMLPMYSTVVLFLSAILWAKFSRSNVLDNDPRAYCWAFGTIFANISCRLIVSQMTSTRCQAMNALVAVYAVISSCFVVANLLNMSHADLELFVVRSLAIVFTVAHVHYAVCVVRQMCEYFDIYCFSIKHKVKTNVQAAESTAPLLVESEDFLEP